MPKLCKFVLVLLLACVVGYAVGRGYNFLTDGFSISNITYDKPYDPQWETEVPADVIANALHQPYSYLSKGHQTYVFASEDGKYVIKFLKCHLIEIKPWLSALPLPQLLEPWREGRLQSKKKRRDAIFAGWKIAYDRLQQETGVIAVHMNATDNLKIRLSVKNKSGWPAEIDLDKTAFLVQRKVDPFIPTLEAYAHSGEEKKAEALISKLLLVYQRLCSLGISDSDPQIMRNTGVWEGLPILIDVGRLKDDPTVRNHKRCINEIEMKTRLFADWLKDRYPALAQYLEEQIMEIRRRHVAAASSK